MKLNVAAGASVVLGCAGLAWAQEGQTLLELLVSSDGVHFSTHVDVTPGQRVVMQARVSLLGATALGFSGINFQPTIGNWDSVGNGTATDRLLAFADTGSNLTTPAGSVPDTPGLDGPFGRIYPFGAPNVQASNRLRGHLDAGGTVMRVAQDGTTNAPGAGSGFNNVNGAGGVPIAQPSGLFAPPPSFVYGTENIVILKLGVDMSTDTPGTPRTLVVDAPIDGVSLYGPNSDVRAGNWITGESPIPEPHSNYAPVDVVGATINVVPSGGAGIPLIGLLAMSARRGRRA